MPEVMHYPESDTAEVMRIRAELTQERRARHLIENQLATMSSALSGALEKVTEEAERRRKSESQLTEAIDLGMTRFHHVRTAGFASVGLNISTYERPEAKVQSLLDDPVVEAGLRQPAQRDLTGRPEASLCASAD